VTSAVTVSGGVNDMAAVGTSRAQLGRRAEHLFDTVGDVAVARDELALDELAQRARPVVLAGDERLPVVPALEPLVPGAGLRRGSIVSVTGSNTLLLALMVEASQAGSWCAVVGLPDLGLVAAAGLGVALERLALVPDPGSQWPVVAGALLDAVDVVAVQPPARLRPADARRLRSKARERGSVLIAAGGWPDGADVRLAVTGRTWTGLAAGSGHLQACELEVAVSGRGAAARERRSRLVLDHHSELAAGTGLPGPMAPPVRRVGAVGAVDAIASVATAG
jgi:hypothetical protein